MNMALTSQGRIRPTKTDIFPSPVRGWIQSGSELSAKPDSCAVLDNFICTAEGARLRGGSSELADLGAQAERLFTYRSGSQEELFGATAADIFDCSDVAGGAVLAAQASGDWSTQQISTAGGEFLVGVNGADTGFVYDGTTWSALAVTGVASTGLSQVWMWGERLFFVEEGTSTAWYLPVESIGGALTSLNLGSVFEDGGALLFGATWSLDSGSGLDDVCIFVSTTGEIAVYEGTDPTSANTWSRVGVYEIGEPLNKHASFKAGGDLAILTEDGIVPVSAALKKDRAALQSDAITFPIEDAWKEVIRNRSVTYPISATLWQSSTSLIVGTPATESGKAISFISNSRTGAWSRTTGWDIRCSAIWDDKFYFAGANGKVYRGDVGGSDDGVSYTGIYVPKHRTYKVERSANFAGLTYRSSESVYFEMDCFEDYNVGEISPPVASFVDVGAVWGGGVWGVFVWGVGVELETFTEWQTVFAQGLSLAPSVAITSNQVGQLTFEILATRLRSEEGDEI